jgi:CHAT domain-containing protein
MRAARALAAELGVAVERARVALAEARIADLSGDAPRVIRVLDAARPEIATGGESMVAEAAALRLRAYARLGQLDAAAAAGRQAVATIERVRGNYGSGELRVSFASDRAGVYADLVVVLLRLGRPAEAFEVADLAHGRALLDHIASARADVERSGQSGRAVLEADELLRKIDALLKKLRELEQTSPRERAPHIVATTRDLADRVAEARSKYEALVARGPQSEQSMALLGAAAGSARAVQASLDPGEVMLEYLVTPARLIVFVVTRTAISSLTSDVTRDDLLQRTRLVRDLMARSRPDGRERPMLEALYDALIRPIAATGALRDAHRLIIVRHSALTYLPFAALANRDTHRYLVEDMPLLYVPSAASLAALRALGDGNARTIAGAPEAFAPFPERLPGTVTEAKSFAGSVAGARSLVGGSATEGRLREALRAGAAVHVATHGVMNARNPLFSRIELAPLPGGGPDDNGRLEVHELLDLRIASPLVFLSGCETGVGDAWSNVFIVGDDYTTLAQSLLLAGAANVVATLWRIDDEAAATLAGRFYERARSVPAPEALALAQQAMLHDPSRSGPYFWASYEVTGGERLHHVLQFSR